VSETSTTTAKHHYNASLQRIITTHHRNASPQQGGGLVKKLLTALWLASNLAAGAALAQAFPPNEAGVTMGHWHLNSANVEANKKIFVALGGKAIKPGDFEIVMFPGVAVYLHLRPGAAPPSGGTVGSVVNHVGFIVKDVQGQTAQWKAAGVPVLPGNDGRLDQAYVVTPDGLRIEVLEDKNQAMPIRHEHVHFFVPEAEVPKVQAWYAKIFGAKEGTRNNAPVDDIPGVQLRFAKADAAQATTKGRVLDHIGFDITNLEAFNKKLEANGVKLDRPLTRNEQSGDALEFITDPWGTYIELNERRKPLM
jgi:catechol 2,3-dioxygenase-like lactoylglutathione lyase family enzyme